MNKEKSAIEELTELLNAYPVNSYSKLQCIDQSKNQYKYYILMIESNGDSTFSLTVNYGRIGSSSMKKVYIKNSSEQSCKKMAEKLYNQKVNKGYIQVSSGWAAECVPELKRRV